MSFIDRVRSLLGGGSSAPRARRSDDPGHSDDGPRGGETNLEASMGLPAAPVDPLGTPAPEAAPGPEPTPPPNARPEG
jgi:hypothetical protein